MCTGASQEVAWTGVAVWAVGLEGGCHASQCWELATALRIVKGINGGGPLGTDISGIVGSVAGKHRDPSSTHSPKWTIGGGKPTWLQHPCV